MQQSFGGLAKNPEFVFEVSGGPPTARRWLRCWHPPPAWSCGTEATGALLPRNADALRQVGYWEAWREIAGRLDD